MNAQEQPGSWWNDWFVWLADQAGERQPSVSHIGNANFPALESAPGRYVMQ
jgi:polyhydroxyalkanoate synthase